MTDAQTHGRTDAQGLRTLYLAVRLCVCAFVPAVLACRPSDDALRSEAQVHQNDVPVAVNGESPFQYPADLYDQGIEGEVRLRLWVDSTGRVAADSTRIISSSGTPALDSAALRGAGQLQFAPAHRDGHPVGAAFYQPVIFRRHAAPGGPPIP
jgi:TonB family protein